MRVGGYCLLAARPAVPDVHPEAYECITHHHCRLLSLLFWLRTELAACAWCPHGNPNIMIASCQAQDQASDQSQAAQCDAPRSPLLCVLFLDTPDRDSDRAATQAAGHVSMPGIDRSLFFSGCPFFLSASPSRGNRVALYFPYLFLWKVFSHWSNLSRVTLSRAQFLSHPFIPA